MANTHRLRARLEVNEQDVYRLKEGWKESLRRSERANQAGGW